MRFARREDEVDVAKDRLFEACLEALGQVQEAMEYHRRSVAADPKSP